MTGPSKVEPPRRSWPDYAAVWRWHFYAGLFCLPFICWLAVTGSIYLFRPQIEAWLDRPYEALPLEGPRAAPSSEAAAALATLPGAFFSHYEPPATATGAAQILVGRDGHLFRVYVHPGTLRAMKVVQDDHRPMDLVSHLHGQLLLGSRGSMLVELAASWAVVMILTGFYLWFPRGAKRLGGLLYPRLGLGGRLFWRDLHAVTGLWVSVVTLFLLLSGMPWSTNWGNYLTWARDHWEATAGKPDWPIGGVGQTDPAAPAMPGMTPEEMAAMSPSATSTRQPEGPGPDLRPLDSLVPAAAKLDAPRPVWISPPAQGMRDWTVSSHAQNRPLRMTYTVNPVSGAVTGKNGFAQQNIVDKIVNVAVATHEGQFFGWLNQVILLFTAISLVLVSVSGVVMWWRRRPAHLLGAPSASARPRFSALLVIAIVLLALILPLFGLSLLLVMALERTLLRHLSTVRRWLGLTSHEA